MWLKLLLSRVARWFIFKPKIPIWVNFGYFMVIWNGIFILPFGTFCVHLVHFGFICVHLISFSGFGIMYQEKSGNPASEARSISAKIFDSNS
jgi:hypothetical protein